MYAQTNVGLLCCVGFGSNIDAALGFQHVTGMSRIAICGLSGCNIFLNIIS